MGESICLQHRFCHNFFVFKKKPRDLQLFWSYWPFTSDVIKILRVKCTRSSKLFFFFISHLCKMSCHFKVTYTSTLVMSAITVFQIKHFNLCVQISSEVSEVHSKKLRIKLNLSYDLRQPRSQGLGSTLYLCKKVIFFFLRISVLKEGTNNHVNLSLNYDFNALKLGRIFYRS